MEIFDLVWEFVDDYGIVFGVVLYDFDYVVLVVDDVVLMY